MPALREIPDVRQVPGERRRRWFTSADMDLIVWLEASGAPVAFQLCYDKGTSERAFTCGADGAASHVFVDDGEDRNSGPKETPVLGHDALFDALRVEGIFAEAGRALPAPIVDLVRREIRRFGERADPLKKR